MITLELSKAEALLYMEMLKRNTREMLDQIGENMDEAVAKEEMTIAARSNYVTNLENEVKNLRAQLDAKNIAAESNKLYGKPKAKPAKKQPLIKSPAPWGYKKDGTPKKKPGGRPGF